MSSPLRVVTFLIVAALLLPVAPSAEGSTRAGRRPNVLIVLTDDQRAQTMAVMPKTRAWLGRGGVTFRNAFVTTPLCCPSRASILTGQYAHNHGVRSNEETAVDQLDKRSLLQRRLQEAGYRTGLYGKFLNGWRLAEDPPFFDDWAFFSRGYPDGYSGGTWNVNGELRTVETYSTRFIQRRALRFLRASEERDHQPWFLLLATWAPHLPTVAERRYRRAPVPRWAGNPSVWHRDLSTKPPHVRDRPRHDPDLELRRGRTVRRRQLRTLMSVDDLVDRVMRKLVALDEDRETLVLFLSDNGYMWFDHGLQGKGHPYTPSIQMPLLARWPGRLPAGKRDDRLVTNLDVAPTIAHAAGIGRDPAFPMDGRSLLRSWSRQRILTEYWGDPNRSAPSWASLRTKSHQYMEYYNELGQTWFREYYDLAADPWQLLNLLGDDDPTNDPSSRRLWILQSRLAQDQACVGIGGVDACP
jgi:arylsulfatase A-like enzyme